LRKEKWCQGEIIDIQGIAEEIWLHAFNGITGTKIDLENPQEDIDISTGLGISYSHLSDLIAMSSPEERACLQYLNTRFNKDKIKLPFTKFGKPNLNKDKSCLSLLPNGQLATKIINLLRRLYQNDKIEISNYPFFKLNDEGENVSYAIHLGVLDILDTTRGKIVSNYLGKKTPSGIIVNIDGKGWHHILKSELENHEEVFRMILEDASSLKCSIFLGDRNIQNDINIFLEMEKKEDYRNIFDFEGEELFDEITREDYKTCKRDDYKPRKMERKDIVPLILIQDPEEDREKSPKNCAVCNKPAIKICDSPDCNEWTTKIEEGWI